MSPEESSPDLGAEDGDAAVISIETLLYEFATADSVPRSVLLACAERFAQTRAVFHSLLARAAGGETLEEPDATLLFRGLHILGAKRDTDSCKPLLKLLRRDPEDLYTMLGEFTTEILPRIAAAVFDGDADTLLAAVTSPEIDEYGREALLRAACFLAWDGRIDRDRMQAFLERFYRERLAPDADIAWVGWIDAVALLGLRSLVPLVSSAWDEGRITPGIMEWSDFEADLAEAERAPDDIGRFERARLGYVDDVLDATAWIRHFEHPEAPLAAEPVMTAPAVERRPPKWPELPVMTNSTEPARNPMRHVGRNDPCPCGSGKKAKKCCLA